MEKKVSFDRTEMLRIYEEFKRIVDFSNGGTDTDDAYILIGLIEGRLNQTMNYE